MNQDFDCKVKEKIFISARKMSLSAANGIGPDIVIIVSSTEYQAAFWQERLTGKNGINGSGQIIKKSAIVLSVTESNWSGVAGNGLGTLNGFLQASKKALDKGYLDITGQLDEDNIDYLIEKFMDFCYGKSVFMYHTAGKGTRTAPLTLSEGNSKPNIKLPGIIAINDLIEPITILESVIRQTSIYASHRENRLCIFWGDQVIINEEDITKKPSHHVEIFGQSVPVDKDISSYGILIPSENGDCSQREKLSLEEILRLLPGKDDKIYKSIGSFTISLSFLHFMFKKDEIKKALLNRTGSLNTDIDWWQPLTSDKEEYIELCSRKGITDREKSALQWDFMQSLWKSFINSDDFTKSGLIRMIGFTDVGQNSLWWDYGQNRFYLRNINILTEDSIDGEASRIFFSIKENEWIKDLKVYDTLKVKDSIILGSTISKGFIEDCVIIDSNLKEVNAKKSVIIGSVIYKLNAYGSLCYNVIQEAVDLQEGNILSDIFHPDLGQFSMKTHIKRDGTEDWRKLLYDNKYTYEEVFSHMSGISADYIKKMKNEVILKLSCRKKDRKSFFMNCKSLKFGTSGLRDTVDNMTDMEVYINTGGFLKYLLNKGYIIYGSSVSVGGDLRQSTPLIMMAVIKAIVDNGCEAELCGFIPSPALAYHGFLHKKASIMITGSHIPADRNGIKFNKPSGEVLKEDEGDILKNIAIARNEEYDKNWEETLFDEKGMFKLIQSYNLTDKQEQVEKEYIQRYVNAFPEGILSGKKIVFYQHSSVGLNVIEKIFKELGGDIIAVKKSEKFIPVDTEKISEDTKRILQDLAMCHKPFAIISTDGDADRPILADENGKFLPGDKLGALVSLFLRPDFAALPVSTNDGVFSLLEHNGIKVVQTKIGSPYVIRAMNDELLKNEKAKVLCWEANGGFLTGSEFYIPHGKILKKLPTRDAVLPLLITIIMALEEKKSISELIKDKLAPRYNMAGVFDDFSSYGLDKDEAIGLMKRIIEEYSPLLKDKAVISFDFENKIIFKLSGNSFEKKSPDFLCSDDLKEWNRTKEKLETLYSMVIKSINILDGIKIDFSCGDVSHLRPSGNAPEFRNYVTASSEDLAMENLERGLQKIIPDLIKTVLERK
jgi:phosphomannomutase